MKPIAIASLVLLASPILSQYQASVFPPFDAPNYPTTLLVCSQELQARGYWTLSQLPSYPNVSAVDADLGGCGTCWELSSSGGGVVAVAAVDGVRHYGLPPSFGLTSAAKDQLLGSNTEGLSLIFPVSAKQVASSVCGL
ncbi:hypothetical protein SERLA73DRAFT_164298 [Serpula lacrymans var. lacrymans S7.3]|uniref:Cerato-platanin n=2 Tax=Serpula lacrymans var. lacrymans TaxID=341189 RepID=F8QIG3_SERL3|nr:uncharacterized protein SERLADRAFT_417838 [Serpula lacrymans var. lacrymans S7.9]EGN91888.1 hypothetical protein SERLA73DRAFT_164298 [Serpula lacrymans var. lacrymans S7.3]EGO20689.1 hypothetical protein SERLADRAFT_417838 [Serpula lacrymans var. lacrymans S7.9]